MIEKKKNLSPPPQPPLFSRIATLSEVGLRNEKKNFNKKKEKNLIAVP